MGYFFKEPASVLSKPPVVQISLKKTVPIFENPSTSWASLRRFKFPSKNRSPFWKPVSVLGKPPAVQISLKKRSPFCLTRQRLGQASGGSNFPQKNGLGNLWGLVVSSGLLLGWLGSLGWQGSQIFALVWGCERENHWTTKRIQPVVTIGLEFQIRLVWG